MPEIELKSGQLINQQKVKPERECTGGAIIKDNDCEVCVSSEVSLSREVLKISLKIKTLNTHPIIQMAVLELDKNCFVQIGDLPSNLLPNNDAFNLTFKKEVSFAVNLPLNNNGFNFNGREIISDEIKINAEKFPAFLHITTEEICKLLPILAKAESDIAAKLASELLFCRYGRLILTIINNQLFSSKRAGTVEVEHKKEFFSHLLDKYGKTGYSWFSSYNSAPNIDFKMVLGEKVRGVCGNLLGKGKTKKSLMLIDVKSMDDLVSYTDTELGGKVRAERSDIAEKGISNSLKRVNVESMTDLVSDTYDHVNRSFTKIPEVSAQNFYSQIIKKLIKLRKNNAEKKEFYESCFGIIDKGKYKEIVTEMFWKHRNNKTGLNLSLYEQLIENPNQTTIDELKDKLKDKLLLNPNRSQLILYQIKCLENVKLDYFKELGQSIDTTCNTLVQGKQRDINTVIREITGGLSKERFKALMYNPSEEEKVQQIENVIKELSNILPSDGKKYEPLKKEIECFVKLDKTLMYNPSEDEKVQQIENIIKELSNILPSEGKEYERLKNEIDYLKELDMEKFKLTTTYLFFKSWIDKKELNPDEETNGK